LFGLDPWHWGAGQVRQIQVFGGTDGALCYPDRRIWHTCPASHLPSKLCGAGGAVPGIRLEQVNNHLTALYFRV